MVKETADRKPEMKSGLTETIFHQLLRCDRSLTKEELMELTGLRKTQLKTPLSWLVKNDWISSDFDFKLSLNRRRYRVKR